MEDKKTPKANLENKRFIFSQIGIILALVFVFFAFEYKSYDTILYDVASNSDDGFIEEIEIPITKQNRPEPPQSPAPQPAPVILKVVDNNQDVESFDLKTETDDTEAIAEIPDIIDEEEPVEEPPFIVVEVSPEFIGGKRSLMKYLQNNIKYPVMARESGIQGTVYLNFIVEKDGSITDIKVLRDIGGGCGDEAVRVVRGMPKWNPGMQRGKPVRVSFNLPVSFMLQ